MTSLHTAVGTLHGVANSLRERAWSHQVVSAAVETLQGVTNSLAEVVISEDILQTIQIWQQQGTTPVHVLTALEKPLPLLPGWPDVEVAMVDVALRKGRGRR